MAGRMARSLSFPVSTPRAQFLAAVKCRPSASSYQQRSVSLPVRLHPFVSNLEHEISGLRSWLDGCDGCYSGSPAWIIDGLARIEQLHSSLADLFQHPQALDALRRLSPWAYRLLDDSLRFADVHGRFQSSILALKDNYSDARAAVRRRYEAGLAAAVRAQRKTEKELLKLAAATRNIGRSPPTPLAVKDAAEAEIAGIAWVAVEVAASASAAVFAGIGHLGSAAAAGLSTSQQTSCMVWAIMWRSAAFRKRMEKEMNEKEGEKRWKAAMKKMETTERCIAYVESWSHRTFRRMLNTRVFLLNALSPTL